MKEYFAAVIGAGASGLMASQRLARAGKSVVLLEAQEKVGRKLLATGNGRCNISHTGLSADDYDNPFVRGVLERYGYDRVKEEFRLLGIPYRTDEEGRAYPASLQSSGVLDALRYAVKRYGVDVREGMRVVAIKRDGGLFCVKTVKETIRCRKVLLACGGSAAPQLGGCDDGYRLAKALGHHCAPVSCALSPIPVREKTIRSLKGLRARCEVAVCADGEICARESGEVLFQDDAISGIVSMQLSSFVVKLCDEGKKPYVLIRFCENAREVVRERISLMPQRPAGDILNGLLPRMIGETLVKTAGISLTKAAGEMTENEIRSLASQLAGWKLAVDAPRDMKLAQVTRGGLKTDEFCPETLMSRLTEGFYAAGEVLDVCGKCGGYNLHWAWAGALCAAEDMIGSRV